MIDGIDWIGEVVARESIDCGWVKGGAYRVATSAPQLARAKAGLEAKRARGYSGRRHLVRDAPPRSRREVRIAGALGGTYTPHCARVDPARLARGLAEACERRGVVIYERSPAVSIAPGRVTCADGSLRADVVVRATEAFTTRLPGREPQLPPARLAHARDRAAPAGGLGRARLGRLRARSPTSATSSSTPSGRRTGGSRSAAAGSPIGSAGRSASRTRCSPRSTRRLEQALRRLFPAAASATDQPSLGRLLRRAARLEHERRASTAPRGSRAPVATRATASSPRASPGARSPT